MCGVLKKIINSMVRKTRYNWLIPYSLIGVVMELDFVLRHIMDALVSVDSSGVPFKNFQPGVGPYGEPQLLKLIAHYFNNIFTFSAQVVTRRTPDLLMPGEWAIEFKIARPFGDNGKEAEDWSVNLLHPYPGNSSSIGDCYKLLEYKGVERRAVVVIGYEHTPAKIDLNPLIESFEAIAKYVACLSLSCRIERRYSNLVHPVHQTARIFAWEVLGYMS
jgi:hypothetical protein